MTLPAPRLDDRRFQDIVDDAKRKITRLCPEWTDHNVSDPGVALIELYAWMTEMILYRINQVPDRLYVKFLELMGIELYGSKAAKTDLLFRLIAPHGETVRVPAGTQVSTERTGQDEPVVFMTREELSIVPPGLVACLTRAGKEHRDNTSDLLRRETPVVCFRSLTAGDALNLGFSESLAGNLITIAMVTGREGANVNPKNPPIRWESWTGQTWQPVRVLENTTDGLNCPNGGEVTMLLPPVQPIHQLELKRAHWIRCKLLVPKEGQKTYARSPEVRELSVVTIGGSVPAQHAQPAPAELLGLSNGDPGQSFVVRRFPVLKRRPDETVRVVEQRVDTAGEPLEQLWTEATHFADAGAADKVFTWSDASGEIRFGPRLLASTGRAFQHGAIPPVDAQVFVTGYRHGGGRRGNVGPDKLTTLRTTIPLVQGVTNLEAATGGVDAETVENAKVRGPLTLRSGDRAVTARDFERLTLEAPDTAVARARCLAPELGQPIRVLVVPQVEVPDDQLILDDLALDAETVKSITAYLDERRLLTASVQVVEPVYMGLMVAVQLRAMPGIRPESIRELALAALYEYINPLTGGPDGRGWPFGRSVTRGDIYALLGGIAGVSSVGQLSFFEADLRKNELLDRELQRVEVPERALVMSYHPHQVEVLLP